MVPLMAMVADRSGRSVFDDVGNGQAAAFLNVVGDGQGGDDDGRVGLDRVAGAVEHGAGAKVALGHPKCALDPPQIVVAGDHLYPT